MAKKEYKVGDRIFYECYDGTIDTDIVTGIRDESYIDDNGKEIHYKWLSVDSCYGVEDYSCLSPRDPRCVELAKQYAKFDKHRGEIVASIMDILSPFNEDIKYEILKIVHTKIGQ